MYFFQCHNEKHFSLNDEGSSACALILHHGLKTHRTLNIPFADLLVLFLTHANMDEAFADPLSRRGDYVLNCQRRMIKVGDEEYKLFQQVLKK